MTDTPRLLTIPEAAALLGHDTTATVRKWIQRGHLTAYRIHVGGPQHVLEHDAVECAAQRRRRPHRERLHALTREWLDNTG